MGFIYQKKTVSFSILSRSSNRSLPYMAPASHLHQTLFPPHPLEPPVFFSAYIAWTMSPRHVSSDFQSSFMRLFHLGRDTLSHAWSLSPLRLVPHDQQRKGRPVPCRRLHACALHLPSKPTSYNEVEYFQNMGYTWAVLIQWITRNTAAPHRAHKTMTEQHCGSACNVCCMYDIHDLYFIALVAV